MVESHRDRTAYGVRRNAIRSTRHKVLLATGFWLLLSTSVYAAPQLVDNFEKESNALGSTNGVYQMAPSRAISRRSEDVFYGPSGHALALRYDKQNTGGPGNGGGWCGFYMLTKRGSKYFDASAFSTLTFYVKGETGSENFVVGLSDEHWDQVGDSVKSPQIGQFLPDGKITTNWQKAQIPLKTFYVDLTKLASVAICFEPECFPNGAGKGTIYIDEVVLE